MHYHNAALESGPSHNTDNVINITGYNATFIVKIGTLQTYESALSKQATITTRTK